MNIKLLLATILSIPTVNAQTINTLPSGIEKERIDYYASGAISDRTIQDLNGNAISKENYFESGKLQCRYYFNRPYENVNEVYYENGQIKSRCVRNIIYPDGEWKEYYPNGNKKSVKVYEEGKRTGIWYEYFENGSIQSKIDYSAISSENDERESVYFHSNGNLARHTSYLNSQPHGKSVSYWPDGKVQSNHFYYKGEEDGEWLSYTPSGKIGNPRIYQSKLRKSDEVTNSENFSNSLISKLMMFDGSKLLERVNELTVDSELPLVVFKSGLMNCIGIELSFDISGHTGTENYFFDINTNKQIILYSEIESDKMSDFKKELLVRQQRKLLEYKEVYKNSPEWSQLKSDWQLLYDRVRVNDEQDFEISEISIQKIAVSFNKPLGGASNKANWLYENIEFNNEEISKFLKDKSVFDNIYIK